MERLWQGGYRLWRESTGEVEVRFVGARRASGPAVAAVGGPPKGSPRVPSESRRDEIEARPRILAAVCAAGEAVPACVGLRQRHSARVVVAQREDRPGENESPARPVELEREPPERCLIGEGDALVTGERGLALSVITADCVPVLLAGDGAVAAVHAGWRGIESGVVPAAVRELAGRLGARPARLTAWIGPAIGPCCYEVGDDVAARVVAAVPGGGAAVRTVGNGEKPHLDLTAAVTAQLAAAGVPEPRVARACTRCHPEELHSYRREGKGAGRNVAYVWLR